MEIDVDDSSFKEKVLEQSKRVPVLVDFWAEWCLPCLLLKPVLKKLTKEYNGKFILAECNVDKTKTKAVEYNVSAIPAVKLFKGSKVVAEFIGALSEKEVRKFLEKI